MEKFKTWEDVYGALLSGDYKDILDTEFETDRYYEIPTMIDYFRENGDDDKVEFLIHLEEEIEKTEGRKFTIGDKFLLDDELVKCVVEIVDFDENDSAYIEYSDIVYKTDKREISQNFNIQELKRIR